MSILDKTADNAVLRSQRAKNPNLALKAKVIVEEEEEEEDEESNPEDTKYDYHEHMALASRQFWSKKNTRPNFNKNNSSGGSNELELVSTVAMLAISLRIVHTRSGKTMVASSFEKTKPSPSPTRTTSPRRHLLAGWWFKKNTVRMTMMMKIVKQWPWHLLPLPQLPGCLSLIHPTRTSSPSASWLKPPTR